MSRYDLLKGKRPVEVIEKKELEAPMASFSAKIYGKRSAQNRRKKNVP